MAHRLRRLSLRARRIVLALCALMLVLQPVSAALGEWHELAHVPSGTHAGVGMVRAGSIDTGHAADSNASTAAMLHVLVDAAHGCGPGAAMAPLVPALVPVRPGVLRLQPLHDRLTPIAMDSPFRPPIAA